MKGGGTVEVGMSKVDPHLGSFHTTVSLFRNISKQEVSLVYTTEY